MESHSIGSVDLDVDKNGCLVKNNSIACADGTGTSQRWSTELDNNILNTFLKGPKMRFLMIMNEDTKNLQRFSPELLKRN